VAEKPSRWDERLREHSVAGVAVLVLGSMAAVSIVRAFFIEGVPWLLSFVDPVSQALRPLVQFVSDNADVLAVGVVTGVSGVVAARVVAGTRRRERVWMAGREMVMAEHALVEARLKSQQERLFDLERELARAQGRVARVGQPFTAGLVSDGIRDLMAAEVSVRDLPPDIQAKFLPAKGDAPVSERDVPIAGNDDEVE
jgi:hypothetical protein